MFLFHLVNYRWPSKAHFINSTVWCDCLFSKLEDQEAQIIDHTLEALILGPILSISCSNDVKLSEPAKIMAGSGYLPRRFGEKFFTDIARWHEFGEDHFQVMCMVSEIFNLACEWKGFSKIRISCIKNFAQVQNDGCLTPILKHQLLLFICTYMCFEIEFVDKFLKSVVSTHTPFATWVKPNCDKGNPLPSTQFFLRLVNF